MLIIPILVLLLLIVSLFAKIEGGRKQAAILFGLVLLQVILGIALHGVPYVAPLHALNAFAILVVAYQAGKRAGGSAELPASAAVA
jgi:heme A synthase